MPAAEVSVEYIGVADELLFRFQPSPNSTYSESLMCVNGTVEHCLCLYLPITKEAIESLDRLSSQVDAVREYMRQRLSVLIGGISHARLSDRSSN